MIFKFFFSNDWIVDKNLLRITVKKFLNDTKQYQINFQESKEFEKVVFVSTSSFAFTEQRFSQLFSISFCSKHIKDDSLFEIFIIWSTLLKLNKKLAMSKSIEHLIEQVLKQIVLNLDFILEQMKILLNIIFATINIKINRFKNELRQLLTIAQQLFLQFSYKQNSAEHSKELLRQEFLKQFRFKNWTSKKISFFDSIANDFESVVNFDKHVFYRNVYAFVNRLKNIVLLQNKNKFKEIISQCLRDTVFIWHFTEFFDVEKRIYRDVFSKLM